MSIVDQLKGLGDWLSDHPVIAALDAAVDQLQDLDLAELDPRLLLRVMRYLEVVHRRFDAGSDRLVDRCETTAAYRADGLADADGAAEASQLGHERRHARVVRNDIDRTYRIESDLGEAQGTVVADIFDAFVEAELQADLAWAKEHLGKDFTLDDLPRTSAQRRADALFGVFRRAAAQPADAQTPEPLVNVIVDQETLEDEIRRTAGDNVDSDPSRVDDVLCHTTAGDSLHPSDVIAALIVGHVRRVVVDSASNVIDVGRKRRLFTGTARDAAVLQAVIRDRGGTGCRWPGCDARHRKLQVDHRWAWTRGGPTRTDNSDLACGVHNRLKESGFTPVRGPDGRWTILRPDKTPITPPA